jgi:hypothetical protein
MSHAGVFVAVTCVAGLSACGGAIGDEYHCRVTSVYDETVDKSFKTAIPEFVFTVADETDTTVAGQAPSVGVNRMGVPPYIVISKLDGEFRGMQVQRGDHSTYYKGFCKQRS